MSVQSDVYYFYDFYYANKENKESLSRSSLEPPFSYANVYFFILVFMLAWICYD